MGRVKRKSAFEYSKNVQILIRAFTLHWNILLYSVILFADSEGPDQTARMRRLIWAFAVCICSNTRFLIARPEQDRRRPGTPNSQTTSSLFPNKVITVLDRLH